MKFLGNSVKHVFLTEMYYIDDVDNSELAKEILSCEKVRMSDDPSHTFFEDFEYQDGVQLNKLKTIIEDLSKSKGLLLWDIWFHIHLPNESSMPHTHLGNNNQISFVYYVKTPKNCGDLYFKNSLFNHIKQESFEGLLVLFPSDVEHFVSKNMSNEIRISIAGNFSNPEDTKCN